MKKIMPLIGAIISLIIVYYSGLIQTYHLANLGWFTNATLLGGGIGIGLAILLQWYKGIKSRKAISLEFTLAALFIIAVGVTWYAGKIFIDSNKFEVMAGRVWYYGYHTSAALFIPTVTAMIRKLFSKA